MLGQFASRVGGNICKALPYDNFILKRQVPSKCCGLEHECEALGGHWSSLGGSLEVLGGFWGCPRGYQKRRLFSEGVLGWSWEALGVFFEVLGDPWDSPEKSKCCYFVGFRWFSEM